MGTFILMFGVLILTKNSYTRIIEKDLEAPNQAECNLNLRDRLKCSDFGILEEECNKRGCCFDIHLVMCYYPASCEQVFAISGGDSAIFLMPGQDVAGKGSWSNMLGGKWCRREYKPIEYEFSFMFDLNERRLLTAKIEHIISEDYIFPFNITFRSDRELWYRLNPYIRFKYGSNNRNSINSYRVMFEANAINILPMLTGIFQCSSIQIIACNALPVPTTIPPTTTEQQTTIMPTTEAPEPTTAPVRRNPQNSVMDFRPSAIAIGSLGSIIMITFLVVIFLLDLTTYYSNFKFAFRCILSYIKYRQRLSKHLKEERDVILVAKKSKREKTVCSASSPTTMIYRPNYVMQEEEEPL